MNYDIFDNNLGKAKVPVVSGPRLHSGVQTLVGAMPVSYLVPDNFQIPRRDTAKKEGYQRDISQARVNKLKSDLTKGKVDLPTAILLNLRNVVVEQVTDSDAGGLYLKNPSVSQSGPFYVVDGQHRLVALSELAQIDPDRWMNFLIPFVVMIGASERQEMEQFYVVNTNAKSVRTDLALDLLKQRAETDSSFMQILIERGEDWKVKGEAIVEALAKDSPVWKYRIRFPNKPRQDSTITSSSVVNSLRHVLHTPYFEALKIDDQIKILDAYWRGIRDVLPDALSDAPQDFTIQKGIGVTVLHNILIVVLEHIRSKGMSVTDKDSYVKVMTDPLLKLQGDNQKGEVVGGVDFWRTAPLGAAGQYSSSAGQRVLIAKIKAHLPEMEVE